MIKKNDYLTVTVTELTYAGLGFVKIDEFPVFIYNALPGEKVEIKILKVLKKYAFGQVINFYNFSSDRNQDINYINLQTGLAPLSHLKYSAQLKFKQIQFKETLHKFGIDPQIEKIVASPQIIRYRNKSQVPVRQINGKLSIGFFRSHSHHLIPTTDFLLEEQIINQNMIKIQNILRNLKIPAYNELDQTGIIRNLMFRYGKFTDELMLILVANTKMIPAFQQLVQAVKNKCPDITSFVININSQKTNVILGKENEVIFGSPYLTDQILGSTFKISPLSFYQINPLQTENLYKIAANFGKLQKKDSVMDAYSGIGTIGITLANQVKQVIGVESINSSVSDAKENVQLNQLHNVRYELGKAEKVIDQWVKQHIKVNKIFVDPPRKGLDVNFITQCCKLKPERIVYISCNPATLGRDLVLFQDHGYHLEKVQPVDMFPQTTHLESVSALVKN